MGKTERASLEPPNLFPAEVGFLSGRNTDGQLLTTPPAINPAKGKQTAL